jgi:ATP-binding cassette subfamily C protein CydC
MMLLGTLLGLITLVASIGLLSLAGWFISAAAIAGLTTATALNFNFFNPSAGVRFFALLRTGGRYAERLVNHDATLRLLAQLRSWFYQCIEPLSPNQLGRYQSGDLLNRLVSDIDALDHLYLRLLSPTIIAVIIAIGASLFVGFWAPGLALILILGFAICGLLLPFSVAKLNSRQGQRLIQLTADLRSQVVDMVQGMAELLIYNAQASYYKKFLQVNRDLLKQQLASRQLSGLLLGLTSLATGLTTLLVLYIGVGLVNQGQLQGVDLALVVFATLASFEAITPLASAYQHLGRTQSAGRRILNLANQPPQIAFVQQSIQQPQGHQLVFQQLDFAYQSHHPVLKQFSLTIEQGQHLAILGKSGSGKSTLLSLLARFCEPQRGHISLGGVDISQLTETDLRQLISIVPQRPHIFNDSLRANLALANPQASEQQMREALDQVQLSDYLDSLPQGLETMAGEGGSHLSGGQARRLALAQALLRDAPVLVLDEPTEGLDASTERQVLANIRRWQTQRTLILISHRLAGLAQLDQLIIIEQGRVAAQGNYQQLISESSHYRHLLTQHQPSLSH